MAVEPFVIRFPDEALADLARRLDATRLPQPLPGAGWSGGVDLDWLAGLVEHWRTRFDWRAVEAQLNRHEHAYADVRGQRVHFLHARSPHPCAMPLLMTHGWPGSVLEFLKVIGPLTDPTSHGGDARDAFHVVAPSIPGYGLSPAPTRPGFDIREVGRTVAALMGELGYTRYGAQGGDWGSAASSWAAISDPEHCAGIHLNLVFAQPPPHGQRDVLTEREAAAIEETRAYMRTGTAYQRVQGLEPDLIGIAMTDSPAALCAWIVAKFRSWSDCGGDVEARFTKDELLANVTWYWLTASGASAARLYRESMLSGRFGGPTERVEAPTACALFPREMFRPPRIWAERQYNVQRWTEMPSGGHFAAMEEPAALVQDIREFFRTLR